MKPYKLKWIAMTSRRRRSRIRAAVRLEEWLQARTVRLPPALPPSLWSGAWP